MVFSVAIVQDIYRDRSGGWRRVHVAANTLAVVLFLAQGLTGVRDLLEIPLGWQKPYVQALYEKACQTQTCTVNAPRVP